MIGDEDLHAEPMRLIHPGMAGDAVIDGDNNVWLHIRS